MVLEETLESPLDNKEIKPANPKGNQSWILFGRSDAEVEAPTLWPLDEKSRFIRKKPWCWGRLKAEGADRGWDGWIASQIQWNELGHTLGDSEGQQGLASCSPWCCTESDIIEQQRQQSSIRTTCISAHLLLVPAVGCAWPQASVSLAEQWAWWGE